MRLIYFSVCAFLVIFGSCETSSRRRVIRSSNGQMLFDNYVNFVTYSGNSNFQLLFFLGLLIKLCVCVLIEARNRLNVFPSSLLNEISDELVLDRIENELVYKTTNNEERPRDLDEIMRELADFDQIAVDTATETIYVGARFVHVYSFYILSLQLYLKSTIFRNYLVKLSYKTSRLKLENVETDLVSWKPTDDVYQVSLLTF